MESDFPYFIFCLENTIIERVGKSQIQLERIGNSVQSFICEKLIRILDRVFAVIISFVYWFFKSSANIKLKSLKQLIDFIRSIKEELDYLEQIEESEINRDWSSIAKLDSSELRLHKKVIRITLAFLRV